MLIYMHARVAAASTPHTPTISTTKEPPSQLQCRRYIVLSHQSGQRWVWEEPDPACGRSWGQNPLWATATGRARERVVTGLSSRALARIAALNTECADCRLTQISPTSEGTLGIRIFYLSALPASQVSQVINCPQILASFLSSLS